MNNSQCDDCIHLLHYQYDRETDIDCRLNHKARLYPPVTDCEDWDTSKNCYNCKHNKSVHDGYALDGMCAKNIMNNDGTYDYDYYHEPLESICPEWEWEDE